MKKEYILKHKNHEVITFVMDDECYKLIGIGNIIDKKRLPFGLEDDTNIVEISVQLNSWIRGRGLSGSRKDLNDIKKLFNTNEECELTVKSYGLNLTDHYWLHEKDKDIKWEEVNCFDNTFDEVKLGNNFDPSIDKNVKTPSPNFCVDGSIQKRWVINENDERVLLKGSRYERMQEPFNELIASKIMDEFGIDHVRYDLKRTKEYIPYSECKTMADKNNEYINAQWVLSVEKYGLKEVYNHYIDICKNNGIKDAKERVDEMITLDFLIGNDDRHKGNFGILRNADTLEWKKIAPIFDNGNSFFYDRDNKSTDSWGIDSLGKAFGDSNRLQLSVIDYPQWYNDAKGKNIVDIVSNCLNYNENLLSERKDKIIEITKERVNVFEKIIKQKVNKNSMSVTVNIPKKGNNVII